MDCKARATIVLCLSDEVLYNVMNEESAAGLWSRLESLYMTKSLSNKLYAKKKLYCLQMKEGTPILQHLNLFNKIVSDLLVLEVKLEEEDKAFLLLGSLPPSYDHLVTTIMYGKKTLELEDVRVVLINNETMKKTDTTEEASGLVVKKDRGRSCSRGHKGDKESSNLGNCYYCKKSGHFEGDFLKREEVLKKAGKKSYGANTSGKSEQAGVVEED